MLAASGVLAEAPFMKSCPTCHLPYPDEYSICPTDGSRLEYLRDWAPGDVIREKYRIVCKIGQGGMGAIFKAEHLVFEELRALKVLTPQLAHDESLIRHLRQEARITRRLSHPNAVRVEDLDRAEDGRVFIVMEYVEGSSLKKVIREVGALPVPRALEITRQVCSALDSAHSLGMIHRDIKPDNVLLVRQPDDRDLAKVLDFGIAKLKEGAKGGGSVTGVTMTKTGFVVGTPDYISPEQAKGKPGDELDGRCDLYSVGVLMFEALTGELPFKSNAPFELLMHHVHSHPPSPRVVRPDLDLPEPVVGIVMRALEKNPDDRFQCAREMIMALTAAADTLEKQALAKKQVLHEARRSGFSSLSPPPIAAPPSVPSVEPDRKEAAASQSIADSSRTETAGEIREEAALREMPAKTPTGRRLLRLPTSRAVLVATIGIFIALVAAAWFAQRTRSQPESPQNGTPPSREASGQVSSATLQPSEKAVEQAKSAVSQPLSSSERQPAGPLSTASAAKTPVKSGEPTSSSSAAPEPMQSTRPEPLRPRGLLPAQEAALKDKLVVADFLMDQSNYEEAIKAYGDALKIDSSNPRARVGLRKARKLQEALKAIIQR